MNDILMYNKYINLFTKLYNYAISSKDKSFEDIPGLIEYYSEYNKPFKKKHIINEYDKQVFIKKTIMKELEEFIDEECSMDDIVSFSSLWQFCQFVRYAEKVVFYKNALDRHFYVDSDMLDVKERLFVIEQKNLDSTYKFKLEKVVDSITKEECKVITLNICRHYGKEMSNIFTIVNEDIKINDQSDQYLITTINLILEKTIKNVLRDCVEQLVRVILNMV